MKAIQETKKLTDKAFGAGVLLKFNSTKTIRAIFDEKLACLEVFWGDFPKEMVDEAHKHGIKVIHQVCIYHCQRYLQMGLDWVAPTETGIIVMQNGSEIQGRTMVDPDPDSSL